MAPKNLQDFIEVLRREGEVVDINTEVDPYLEAAEIHRRVISQGGPALLFRRIKGSPYPLVTNLFGTQRRVELAFGPRPEQIVRQVARLPETLMPPSLGKLWSHRSLLMNLAKVGMKRSSRGAVTECVDDPPRLGDLPLLTTWKLDGGPFVTLPLVYTEHPDTHIPNLGMYRIQRFDDATTGFHAQIGKGAGYHLAVAEGRGEALPVVVHIGGPPALILSAIAPLPENVPELLLASLALGGRLPLVQPSGSSLPFAAEAEFVIEGYINPKERRPEGPFGDHYGYYSLRHDYPVIHVKRVFRRRNAICAATVVGKPRQEDFFLGDYLQSLLSPLFPLVMPAVVDLWSYGETGYHSLAAAVVKQRYKREAMVSAFRILGEGQLALTKFLLLLDSPMDLKDFKSVLEHVLERADFRTDLYLFSNLSMDTLDYTGPKVNEGSKGVLLGVGPPLRNLPREFRGALPTSIKAARAFCGGCLVVEGASYSNEPRLSERLSREEEFAEWPLIVIVDDLSKALKSTESFLWTTFTRFEPGADIEARMKSIARGHIAYEPPIIIDARMKPWYPEELECDPETAELVTERWDSYGIPHG